MISILSLCIAIKFEISVDIIKFMWLFWYSVNFGLELWFHFYSVKKRRLLYKQFSRKWRNVLNCVLKYSTRIKFLYQDTKETALKCSNNLHKIEIKETSRCCEWKVLTLFLRWILFQLWDIHVARLHKN